MITLQYIRQVNLNYKKDCTVYHHYNNQTTLSLPSPSDSVNKLGPPIPYKQEDDN